MPAVTITSFSEYITRKSRESENVFIILNVITVNHCNMSGIPTWLFQIISAAQTLALHPSSKIAKENLEVFCEAWESQLGDVALLLHEIGDVLEGKRGTRRSDENWDSQSLSSFLSTQSFPIRIEVVRNNQSIRCQGHLMPFDTGFFFSSGTVQRGVMCRTFSL